MHVGEMRSTVREFCAGAPLGDVAVLKLDAQALARADALAHVAILLAVNRDQPVEALPRGLFAVCVPRDGARRATNAGATHSAQRRRARRWKLLRPELRQSAR